MAKVTLRDVLPLMWEIEELKVDVRADGKLVHMYIIGAGVGDHLGPGQYRDIEDGKLTVIDTKINVHGDEKKNGAEMAWGVNLKRIQPKELLDMEIDSMRQGSTFGKQYLMAHLEQGEVQMKMDGTDL